MYGRRNGPNGASSKRERAEEKVGKMRARSVSSMNSKGASFKEMEDKLHETFLIRRQRIRGASKGWLCSKVKELMKVHYPHILLERDAASKGTQKFLASAGWLRRFCRRYSVRYRKKITLALLIRKKPGNVVGFG